MRWGRMNPLATGEGESYRRLKMVPFDLNKTTANCKFVLIMICDLDVIIYNQFLCVCVCVCVCARACVRVCVCVRAYVRL